MSINDCTDQWVLALLPPARIASVTWLARDPQYSQLAAAARRVPVNHGGAEDVVSQHPDLVATATATTPATRALLRRLGFPLIEVDDATGWDAIRATTRRLAALFGVAARGEALVAQMNAALVAAGSPTAGPPVRVAAWDGAGGSAPPGSLYAAVLTAAGAIDVGTLPPLHHAMDTEMLLAEAPAVLVQGTPGFDRPDLRGQAGRHPLVRRLWHGRIATVADAAITCGTPFSAAAAVSLRQQLHRVAALAATPLAFAAP